ncbi:hypothetical protein [Simkania sp.]|uniref:hypothetical protein n=1 Tax=Simkania sp. TaxID=34094 RepID=UPI003B517A70
MSQFSDIASTRRSEEAAQIRNEIASTLVSQGHGPQIKQLVEQHHLPEEVAVLAVAVNVIMSLQTPNEKDESLSSEKVTEPPKEAEEIREIPAVATLSEEPKPSGLDRLLEQEKGVRYDPRLAITDFNALPQEKAIGAIDFLLTTNAATPKQVRAIHAYLFENQGAFRDFRKLHGSGQEAQNRQFEKFLQVMDIDLLNENKTWRNLVALYGLSPNRLNWVQIQNDEVNPSLNSDMLAYEAKYRSKNISQDIGSFQQRSPTRFNQWLQLRMSGSKTISTQTNITPKATQNWQAAEKKTRQEATTQGKLGQRVPFGTVQAIHQTLTSGEEANAGKLRNKAVRSSGAVEIYPREINVKEMTGEYERWLNEQIKLCDAGKV